ncbi:Fib_succ_major, fibrobacter succinogenes major paralogous domain [Flavobacteriaceae bacterium]
MKKLFILLAIFTTVATTAQSVGINDDGSAANASAILDLKSTTQGFLPPRMTGAQRATITSPAQGLMIYCTDCGISGEPQYYDGTQWKNLIGGTATTSTARVTIGTQVWATVNLDVTTYRDGTTIPQVTDPTQWSNLSTGAWCYYNNNSSSGTTYGKLYNWYAVAGIHDADPNTPNKVLAPTGWHLPTDAEWTTLTNTLGGTTVAGGKLKATGTSLWDTPNTDATNSSGFSGLPGGRNGNGTFSNVGGYGIWWSSSQYGSTYAWIRFLYYSNGYAYRDYYNKLYGFSVRCLRD